MLIFLDMKETGKSRRKYRSRQTPTSVYPSIPPTLPPGTDVLFLALTPPQQAIAVFEDRIVTSQVLYKPGLLGIARIKFHGSRWDVHVEREINRVIHFPPQPLPADWENLLIGRWDPKLALQDQAGVSFFMYDQSYDFSESRMEALQEDFLQYVIKNEVLEIEYNPTLKLGRKPDETPEGFQTRCMETARLDVENEMRSMEETIQRLHDRLKEKLDREVREIGSETLEMRSLTGSDQILRRPETLRTDVQEEMVVRTSFATIDDIKRQFEELQQLRNQKLQEFEETVRNISMERNKDILRINRGNVEVLRMAILWLPYTEYVIQEEDQRRLELLRSY